MATNVPFPAFFLPTPGEPSIPFKTWRQIFENYLLVIAASGNSWPNSRRRAVLLHCLGTEGQRLFYSLPDAGTTYENAMTALETYFVPKTNVVAERHAFRKRIQLQNETVLQYVTALRHLASTCDFGDRADEVLRDQLVEHVLNPKIRERLLMDSALTLEKAVNTATQIEAAYEQAKAICEPRTASAAVHAVHHAHTRRGRDRGKPQRQNTTTTATASQQGKKTCYRCGSYQHLANAANCPAVSVVCRSCQKRGHFSKVCRATQTRNREVREVEPPEEVDIPEVTVLSTELSAALPSDKITCTVEINTKRSQSCKVNLLVDTGSSVSILPQSIYTEHFRDIPLTRPTVKLVSYNRTSIPVLGCMFADVSLHGRTAPGTFFIAENGTPLMGRDLMTVLSVCIMNNKVLPPDTSAPPTTFTPAPVLQCTDTPAPAVGCARQFVHHVKVDPSITPVRQKLRRLPLSVRGAVSDELKRLLAAGVIEPVDASAWVSPIVVIQKKSGKIRMCVDLREPNKAVVIDSFPLPHMDELLSSLRGSTVFSSIDLATAYYQVPLAVQSRDLTAFITHDGLFRFCRVPYGLASAPAAFQKMMSIILADLPGVQYYIDDVIIHGRDMKTHDEALTATLQRLKAAGLQLNDDKCRFREPSLPFLGHTVSADGLLPDSARIQAIADAPTPTDATTLRSFLGLLSWYSKFLPNHATVVEPMRACLRDTDSAFEWTDEAQSSFEEVKRLLVASPALALFDPALHTIISTDASDYGLGAIMSQIGPDNIERTVAFASRTLSSAERKYAVVEKEALACVWAVERWRTYLWGRRFTLKTDHQALTTLLTTKGVGRAGLRVARWSARLMSYNYDVIYRPGCENAPADCMSRLPLPAVSSAVDPPTAPADDDCEYVALLTTAHKSISAADLDTACASSPELIKLRAIISNGWPASPTGLDPDLLPYYKIRHELSVKDNFVFRGFRLVVPDTLRPTLVNIAHESHQGVVRTKQRLREHYWWPKIDDQVLTAIRACYLCQSNDKTAKPRPGPLQPVPLPDGPWQKIAMDIVGPFETAAPDCRFAITMTDYYSKWPEVAFTRDITTDAVLSFMSTAFSRLGNPLCVTTDNGVQFTSAAFSSFLKERQITHSRSSLYYPAANGAIERFNRVLRQTVQLAIQQNQRWKPAVIDFLHVYRSTPHATTGSSPFELLHGRTMRTKLTVLPPAPDRAPPSEMDIRRRVSDRQDKMKVYTDARRGARTPSFRKGDKVRVRIPHHVMKGHRRYTDPLTIREKIGNSTYILSDGKTWNASHLTAFPNAAARAETADRDFVEPEPAEVDRPPRPRRTIQRSGWLKDYVP